MHAEIDAYDYHLPPELIAQRPLANRSDARLLVVDRAKSSLAHHYVRDLPELLTAGDCLVLNNTRVVPARLVGRRATTGGRWEGLFLAADSSGAWQLLGKTRGKLAAGEEIVLVDREASDDVSLRLIERREGGVWVAMPLSDEPAYSLLERIGRVPLPHYIRGGEMHAEDLHHYQTVYARERGSVAAPTAGLHFTNDLLVRLAKAGIARAEVTLHVGLGTFRPVSAPTLGEHVIHSEHGEISAESVERIRAARAGGHRAVAVGTTSARVLETASSSGELLPWHGETNLFIRPPHRFRAVDALLTNFHLPRSTLLVLVHTFAGAELMRAAYDEAIREQYRFYSYGDAMLIM